ncbi:MAG: patatin-like phospholipase family protein [Planctomycetota bacterium]|nr:patatin-like phospholipase family protein [Planctomycetota bacterium]
MPETRPAPRILAAQWIPCLLLALQGLLACSAPRTLEPVPAEWSARAEVPGFPGIRGFALQSSLVFRESILEAGRLRRQAQATGHELGGVRILALSGGGPNGAFAAGFLKGWTQTGKRPHFDLVTGVSTGSLIAPFAFLGSEFDEVLERLYTSSSSKKLFQSLPFWRILSSNALYDVRALRKVIAGAVTESILEQIAHEHRRGRRLFMLTTNLDVGRAVAWDMGKIACSEQPGALALFQKIMLASASIPLAYPPVYFEVQAEGGTYGEMHFDGGVASQVFMLGLLTDLGEVRSEFGVPSADMTTRVYVLRSGVPRATWSYAPADLRSIGLRSVTIATNSMALGDLLRIHELCQQNDLDFRLAASPVDLAPDGGVEYDDVAIRALFETGRSRGASPSPWWNHPFDMLKDEEPPHSDQPE